MSHINYLTGTHNRNGMAIKVIEILSRKVREIQKFAVLKKCIDVTALFTLIRIYTQKMCIVSLSKNSMFHENYVNNVKCFYFITKEEKSAFPCSIRKTSR